MNKILNISNDFSSMIRVYVPHKIECNTTKRFTRKNAHERNTFFTEIIMGNDDIFSSFVNLLRTVFQRYHPGTLILLAMQYPCRLYILAVYSNLTS